jgi:hypothetical protein
MAAVAVAVAAVLAVVDDVDAVRRAAAELGVVEADAAIEHLERFQTVLTQSRRVRLDPAPPAPRAAACGSGS